MKKEAFFLLLIGGITVALDQISKYWISHTQMPGEIHPLLGHTLCLTLVHNHGGAFGILSGMRFLLLAMGLFVPVLLLVFFRHIAARGTAWIISSALLLGGAMGNFIDRLLRGFVIDFIDLRFKGRNIWPVFNIADIAIDIGIAVLFLLILRGEMAEKPQP